MAELYKYLGGLSVGEPNDRVKVSVSDGQLNIELPSAWLIKGWSTSVPISEITGLQVDTGERISAGRVLMTGLVAFAWKKKTYYLVVETKQAGLDTQVVLSAKQGVLERLRQNIVRAKQDIEADNLDPGSQDDGDTLLAQLANLHAHGVLSDIEFEQKRALLDSASS